MTELHNTTLVLTMLIISMKLTHGESPILPILYYFLSIHVHCLTFSYAYNRSSFKGKTFRNKHQFNITWHPSTLHQDYELKPEEKKMHHYRVQQLCMLDK